MNTMPDVTQILESIVAGDTGATDALFTAVYEELRRLAAQQLAHERPGHTLDATALVHEAYMRLVPASGSPPWQNRRHFFGAAGEAMRRILIEQARHRKRIKRGGGAVRVPLDEHLPAPQIGRDREDEAIAVAEALDALTDTDAQAAELVRLHYFAGVGFNETAKMLGVSPRTAYRIWAFARAWLSRKLADDGAR